MAATFGFYLSGVIAIAIIFIGCRFLLAPSTAAVAYGVPAGAESQLRAYLSAKGIRDIASGLFTAILIAYGSTHVLGWFMLTATLIPVADAVIVLHNGGSRTIAFRRTWRHGSCDADYQWIAVNVMEFEGPCYPGEFSSWYSAQSVCPPYCGSASPERVALGLFRPRQTISALSLKATAMATCRAVGATRAIELS